MPFNTVDKVAHPAPVRPSLVPGDNVEEQFANAVRVALEAGGEISRPEMTAEPTRVRRHGRGHQGLMAFLFAFLTATVAILALAALLR